MTSVIKITNGLAAMLFAVCILLPTQNLQAGASNGSILPDLTGDGASNPNQSPIPNNTPIFSIPGGGVGPIASCLSPTGDPGCAGGGNPINTMTGNKYQIDTDMAALPGVLGIEIVRHYNSLQSSLGQMGYGWRLSYETKLYAVNNTLQIIKADGTRIIFNRSEDNPNDCACQNPAQGHVMIYSGAKGKEYTWFQLDGKQLHFNHQGRLERISIATGESLRITRGPKGELLKVTDPQGRSLEMQYADKNQRGFKGIIAIDSPTGRYTYEHDNDPKSPGYSNLILVQKSTGNSKQMVDQHYHYAEKDYVAGSMAASSKYPVIPKMGHLLTGISHTWQIPDPKDNSKTISKTQRYRTWAYDQLGRGILSVHGYPKQLDAKGKRKPNTGNQQVNLSYQDTLDVQYTKQQKPYPRITRAGEVGKTIITNSQGQKTTYTYTVIAGEYRLLRVIGAGCSECMTPNIVFGYDNVGRMTHTTKVKPVKEAKDNTALTGLHTTQTEYDSVGRVKRIANIAYINGKAQTPKLLVRYEYPNTPVFPKPKNAINALHEEHQVESKPSLIARPSVIKGKEHQSRITYNQAGQPLKITETGYAPALPESTASVSAYLQDITKLSRTTTYTYNKINNHSLLASVDGPLPNGKTNSPKDSDITTYAYDDRGQFLTEVTAPMNRQTKMLYDEETGRVIKAVASNAIAMEYTYNRTTGKITSTNRYPSAYALEKAKALGLLQTTATQYDVFGQPIMVQRADGQAVFMQYGENGKLVSMRDGLGNRVDWKDWNKANLKKDAHNNDTTVSTQQWFTADQPDAVSRAWYFWHDKQNRLTQKLSPNGGLDTWQYSNADSQQQTQNNNQWIAHTDPLNRLDFITRNDTTSAQIKLTPDGYIDADFRSVAALQANPSETVGQPTQLQDDFGRVVQFSSPQHGRHIANYDLANRITRVIQPDGTQIDYQYDIAGRLLQKTATNKTDRSTQTNHQITYRYNAFGLQAVNDGMQMTQYTKDALGREIEKSITLTLQNKAQKTYHIRTRYDAKGRIKAKQIADGNWLVFSLDAKTGLNNAMTLHDPIWPSLTNKLADWFNAPDLPLQIATKETVVKDIKAHPFNGITHLTHGNGINSNFGFDLAGRLITVQHGKGTTSPNGKTSVMQASYQYDEGRRLVAENISIANMPAQAKEYAYQGWNQLATAPKAGYQQATFTRPTARNTNANKQNETTAAAQAQPAEALEQPQADVQIDHAGRVVDDGQYRYQYQTWGRLSTVSNAQGKPLVYYAYNAWGERILSQANHDDGNTHYYLYDKQQRVAELDAAGNITQQYLYVNGMPVAVRNTPNSAQQNQANPAQLLAVHTDRRLTPVAVTDEAGKVIWQARYNAWGRATTTPPPAKGDAWDQGDLPDTSQELDKQFNLALRLPGQWEDDITHIHYNYQRDYNPDTGRYLTPDPLSFPDGLDPYAYVNNDPLNKQDPLGLYESNVHYYMTFFLAVSAGVTPEEARVIALATQYIDDNPITQPLPESKFDAAKNILFDNPAVVKRLETYHFTQVGYDDEPFVYHPTPEERATAIKNGFPDSGPVTFEDSKIYKERRVRTPSNPQLTRLLTASNKAPERCAKLQFFGEYLHAFEDTFAHRDNNNVPININKGLGHGGDLHNPDYTYNHWGVRILLPTYLPFPVNWDVNEDRTLQMEQEVFAKMTQFAIGEDMITAGNITEDAFDELLVKFNQEEDQNKQIGLLQDELDKWFDDGVVNLSKERGDGGYQYDDKDGKKNREAFFCDAQGHRFKQEDYPGTILPQFECTI